MPAMSGKESQRFPFQMGRYRIVSRIGTGSQGHVYEAYLEGIHGFRLKVALKVVGMVPGPLTRGVKAIANEAKALSSVIHPNVVGVHDFSQDGNRYLLAMEFIDGIDLEQLLEHRKAIGRTLPTAAAVQIAEQIAAGLVSVHSLLGREGEPAPLIHRDLKPANVMLTSFGQVKITDFGLAKGRLTSFHTTTRDITRGTPAYMSPEQTQGEELAPASDQFSLGSVIYEMVTGERLFHGSLATVMTAVMRADPKGDPAKVRELCPDLAQVFERCIGRNPEDRFETTLHLYHALRYVRVRLGMEADLSAIIAEARGAGRYDVGDRPSASTQDFFFGTEDPGAEVSSLPHWACTPVEQGDD